MRDRKAKTEKKEKNVLKRKGLTFEDEYIITDMQEIIRRRST